MLAKRSSGWMGYNQKLMLTGQLFHTRTCGMLFYTFRISASGFVCKLAASCGSLLLFTIKVLQMGLERV